TIVELLLRRIRASLAERELQLELTEEAKDLLVEKGWDPSMGARPLRRAIQRYIEDPLADFVLRAELPAGATVMVERAPEGTDPEVTLTVQAPKKVPAAVGGRAEEENGGGDEPADASPAPEPEGAGDEQH
ncbi:MAG: ATP-dependent Clp protease ATP-binding subunit ClpC, partial [Solirubrobacteraceae bacterium]|nr:ATP-dependent Clp protease ATP-binding subunit ClpC [Solirubrobacteraceae bacterium]